jgi:aspartate kinase
MPILVQKFGGTSVSTPDRRRQVVDKVKAARAAGFSPVVVVSAMGRRGESYATDTLLSLAREECPEINTRELDMIMACGEVVAGVIIVGALKNAGFDAVLLNGQQAGIVTTTRHGDAQIVEIRPAHILAHLAEGKIVVVAGFQGATEDGEITTLGRGGSDTSAVALGAAVDAAAVEIYTDVNGVMTADPRIVPAAATIASCSYEDVHRLAVHGAKVIHPRAVEIGWRHGIPIKVKCTFTDEAGTTISNHPDGAVERPRDCSVIGIAHQADYGYLILKNADRNPLGRVGRLLGDMSAAGVDADCMSLSTLETEFAAGAAAIEAVARLGRDAGMEPAGKLGGGARVTLIGSPTSDVSSLANTFIGLLQDENIEVLQAFARPSVISGIVDAKDMVAAVRTLHAHLFENQKSGADAGELVLQ